MQEERDLVGRGELGRHDEVALVLAVLVVDDDDDLAAADGGDGVLDLGERHQVSSRGAACAAPVFQASRRSTYLTVTSTSRLTRSPGPLCPSVVTADGVRDHRHGEPVVQHVDHGEADAVDRDRALLDDVAQQVARHPDPEVGDGLDDVADAVDVALHDVAAEAVLRPDRPFEVDPVPRLAVAEGGALERLVGDVGLPPAGALRHEGEATAVDRDRVAQPGAVEHGGGRDPHPAPSIASTEPSSSTMPVNISCSSQGAGRRVGRRPGVSRG